MATLAFSIARVARRASARSLQAGGDLILRSYRIAGLHPRSNLTGDSSSNRAIQLFGCAHHGARRPLSTPSFNGVNSEAGNPVLGILLRYSSSVNSVAGNPVVRSLYLVAKVLILH